MAFVVAVFGTPVWDDLAGHDMKGNEQQQPLVDR